MDIKAETETIQQFVDKGNYHAAMNIAISALNECHRNNDQNGVELFIEVIREIADTIAQAFAR
jgi:hypothetical protein